jgi:DNA-binding FrmR family transcriptional regulator
VTHGYVVDKEALARRLHRIEGQIRGIERMVDEERYCVDILTQIAAATTALETVAFKILDEHVSHCVRRPGRRGGEEPRAPRRRAPLLENQLRKCRAT